MAKLLAFLIFAAICATTFGTQLRSSGVTPNDLVLVATEGTKRYFADNTGRSWSETRKYCRENGFAFASVDNAAEETALTKAFDSVIFNGDYWVSGRDAQDNRQFVWDETDAQLDAASKFADQDPMDYQTCALFHIKAPQFAETGFKYWTCSYKLRALCQAE